MHKDWNFVVVVFVNFLSDAGKIEVSKSFINKIYSGFSDSIHFAAPVSSLSTNEIDVVMPNSYFLIFFFSLYAFSTQTNFLKLF